MKINIVSVLLAISSASLSAGVLSMTNQNVGAGDTAVLYADDTIATSGIATGGYFNIGYDVNAGLLAATTTGDFSNFILNFNILTTDILGAAGNSGVNGFYFGSFDYGTPGANPPLGAELYSLLGNSDTLTSSSQFAVLKSADTIGLDTPTPDDNNILLPENTTVLLGKAGTTMINFGNGLRTTPSLSLVSAVAIPEPSALLLTALGALALLRRKR